MSGLFRPFLGHAWLTHSFQEFTRISEFSGPITDNVSQTPVSIVDVQRVAGIIIPYTSTEQSRIENQPLPLRNKIKMGKSILLTSIFLRRIIFMGSVKANGVILMDIVQQLNTTTTLVGWALSLQTGVAYILCKYTIFYLMCCRDHRAITTGL